MARTGPEADHRVHRRDRLAGRRGRPAAPLHGTQGDRERHHPLHQREGAGRERALGRGQGTQARARSRSTPAGSRCPPRRVAGAKRALEIARRWAAERVQWGAADRASTTRSPRSSGGWRRTSSPWRRSPTSPRCWPTGAAPTSGSRPRWPRCGTPRSAGGSWTTRCRSRAAAATRRPTASAAAASGPIRSSG